MKKGKLIIFSAPSGSGKSTIINYLLTQNLNLAFSISATSRPPRGTEKHGVEYFFLTPEEFKQRIANNEFLEYEEVYENRFYGTLKAQVEKQLEAGQNVVFDVDVVGGCNIKKFYGEQALSLFIQPPGIEELRNRLVGRGTDAPEVIESRIAKAEFDQRPQKISPADDDTLCHYRTDSLGGSCYGYLHAEIYHCRHYGHRCHHADLEL